MSTREYALRIINTLNEEQLDTFIDFFMSIADRSTVARIESAIIRNDPCPKTYDSFEELVEEMEQEDE